MTSDESPPARHMRIFGITFGTIPIAFVLLLFGVPLYLHERAIVREYVESTCRVSTTLSKYKTCIMLSSGYTCAVAIWRVQYSDLKSINATVQVEYWENERKKAAEALGKYEVCIMPSKA
jgi:hypothetical protein